MRGGLAPCTITARQAACPAPAAARFTARCNELKAADALDSLQKMVFARQNYLSIVQVRNFERWPILGTYVWPNRVVAGTYDGEVIAMNFWLQDRLRWMNGAIGQ